MLLITTTHQPATDLGYLLHKNPERIHTSSVTFGNVHVVYPEANADRCTAALLVDLDSVGLVRRKEGGSGSLAQYVNDRPYVASSFLSVAMSEVFGTAMGGRSKERQEVADRAIPLEIRLPVVPCRGGPERIQRLFEPLGYEVVATQLLLDPEFPEWGESSYFDVTLKGNLRLSDALKHIYILMPVLDARKHYYLDQNEVDKLLTKGKGWLESHPEREWISRAYLGRKPSLLREALEQLANAEESLSAEETSVDEAFVAPEAEEPKVSLHQQRHARIVEVVRELKPKSLIDLGCGDGKLIRKLIPIKGLAKIVGMDVSYHETEKAIRILGLSDAGPRMRERVEIIHGSLMYRDSRLEGFDVATVVEVIEHLDPPRLSAFEKVVFACARPNTVLITTPNREYNVKYEMSDEFRHTDHRFEWTRAEFEAWATKVAEQHGYDVRFEGLGEPDPIHGAPSQMGVFSR